MSLPNADDVMQTNSLTVMQHLGHTLFNALQKPFYARRIGSLNLKTENDGYASVSIASDVTG